MNPSMIPDVVLLSLGPLDDTMIQGVGEYKTWWTVDLHRWSITSPIDRCICLEPLVGKLPKLPKTLFCCPFN